MSALATTTRRLAREPLVLFALFGVGLFAVDGVLHGSVAEGTDGAGAPEVRVSSATLRELHTHFEATAGRPPSDGDLEPLVRRHVRDAVLAREARALGLDVGDLVIERRLVQKMELLLDASVPVARPTDEEVRAFLVEHTAGASVPARVRFEHAYFDRARRDDADADARAALEALGAGTIETAGDAFVLGREVPETALPTIEERFGGGVADAVSEAPVGVWMGPVSGRFGVHLYRVLERREARAPTEAEAAPAARRAIEDERREQGVRRAIEGLIARYDVRVERAPAEAP